MINVKYIHHNNPAGKQLLKFKNKGTRSMSRDVALSLLIVFIVLIDFE